MEWMKANPTQDPIFGEGSIRADGRHMHDMFLMEVNSPDEAQYEGDYFTALATIPADKAFRPLDEGGYPLVKSQPQATGRAGWPARPLRRDPHLFELLGIPPQALSALGRASRRERVCQTV